PKERYSKDNWYDVWLPEVSPSPELMKLAKSAKTEKDWDAFLKGYRSEMKEPGPRHVIDLLAALSRTTNFSVGCYCENEAHCHRSVLRELLRERGADIG